MWPPSGTTAPPLSSDADRTLENFAATPWMATLVTRLRSVPLMVTVMPARTRWGCGHSEVTVTFSRRMR